MTNYKIERGQIYMANLGQGKGSIQGGNRPVVVISNPLNNKYSPTINVLPITSKTKNNLPVHVDIGKECGLITESTVLVEQLITINKSQLISLVGRCTLKKMRDIAKAIMIQINLIEDSQVV